VLKILERNERNQEVILSYFHLMNHVVQRVAIYTWSKAKEEEVSYSEKVAGKLDMEVILEASSTSNTN
jgi:flavoprotein